MKWLWLVAAVVFLLVVALFVPVVFEWRFSTEDGCFWRVRYLCFGRRSGQEKKTHKKADKRTPDTKAGPSHSLRGLVREKGLLETAKALAQTVRKVLRDAGRLLGHVHLKRFELLVRVSEADAAETALEYGAVCGILYPLLSAVSACTPVPMNKVCVMADYESGNATLLGAGRATMRPFFFLLFMLRAIQYGRVWLKGERIDDGRKTERADS